jgi:hypothetical protein
MQNPHPSASAPQPQCNIKHHPCDDSQKKPFSSVKAQKIPNQKMLQRGPGRGKKTEDYTNDDDSDVVVAVPWRKGVASAKRSTKASKDNSTLTVVPVTEENMRNCNAGLDFNSDGKELMLTDEYDQSLLKMTNTRVRIPDTKKPLEVHGEVTLGQALPPTIGEPNARRREKNSDGQNNPGHGSRGEVTEDESTNKPSRLSATSTEEIEDDLGASLRKKLGSPCPLDLNKLSELDKDLYQLRNGVDLGGQKVEIGWSQVMRMLVKKGHFNKTQYQAVGGAQALKRRWQKIHDSLCLDDDSDELDSHPCAKSGEPEPVWRKSGHVESTTAEPSSDDSFTQHNLKNTIQEEFVNENSSANVDLDEDSSEDELAKSPYEGSNHSFIDIIQGNSQPHLANTSQSRQSEESDNLTAALFSGSGKRRTVPSPYVYLLKGSVGFDSQTHCPLANASTQTPDVPPVTDAELLLGEADCPVPTTKARFTAVNAEYGAAIDSIIQKTINNNSPPKRKRPKKRPKSAPVVVVLEDSIANAGVDETTLVVKRFSQEEVNDENDDGAAERAHGRWY